MFGNFFFLLTMLNLTIWTLLSQLRKKIIKKLKKQFIV